MSTSQSFEVTVISASDPRFASALRWEFEIFGLVNGYAAARDIQAGRMTWYERYDSSSEFYVARDAHGELAGIVRLIRHDAQRGFSSFSTLVDAGSYSAHGEPAQSYLDPGWAAALRALPPSAFAELATQAIVPRFRRFRAMDALWRGMIERCTAQDVELWTMALVVPLFGFYKSLLPRAVHAIGALMPDYIGADSIPALLRITHSEVQAYLNGSHRAAKERGVVCL
jgi:hypothetical protein